MIKKVAILAAAIAAALGTVGVGTAFANNGKGVGPNGATGHSRSCYAHAQNYGYSYGDCFD